MMSVNNVVSVKSFYRFVEFISKFCNRGLTHEKYKKIALDMDAAESKEEKEVKALSESYAFILNNVNQAFSKAILTKCYFLLTGTIIEELIAEKILKCFYININEGVQHRIMYLQKTIFKMDLYRKIEFAFILSNLIMIQSSRYPLIPFTYIFNDYKLAVKMDDKEKWLLLIAQMEEKPKELNCKSLDKKEIIKLIKPIIANLRNKFNLTFFALYGGVAKEMITTSSDVDFVTSFDESLLDFERGQKLQGLKEYLAGIFGFEVDIIDFTHALNNLDIEEMQNMLVLLKNN